MFSIHELLVLSSYCLSLSPLRIMIWIFRAQLLLKNSRKQSWPRDDIHASITLSPPLRSKIDVCSSPYPWPRDDIHASITLSQALRSKIDVCSSPYLWPRDDIHASITLSQALRSKIDSLQLTTSMTKKCLQHLLCCWGYNICDVTQVWITLWLSYYCDQAVICHMVFRTVCCVTWTFEIPHSAPCCSKKNKNALTMVCNFDLWHSTFRTML